LKNWKIKERLVLPKLYCIVDNCDNYSVTKGYCIKHYAKVRRYDDPLTRKYDSSRGCKIKDCNRKHNRKGYCEYHSGQIYIKNKNAELRQILGQPVCINCGFGDSRALQFDHINGNGNKDRKRFAKGGTNKLMYYILHPDEAREKLQVLCANCNWIKRVTNDETTHKWR